MTQRDKVAWLSLFGWIAFAVVGGALSTLI
jgi:hypothetical protein